MKRRRWISTALAAVLVLGSLAAPAGMAEEAEILDEEIVTYEEFEVDADPGVEPAGDPGLEQTQDPGTTEDSGVEAADQESADDVLLIEDAGVEVVSVSDGADYEEVAAAESEADAAAEKVKELLDGIPLQLESADLERISAYLEGLTTTESPTGSDGELEMASFIEETMRSFGYTISEQHFHEGFLNDDYVDVPGVNIIAERGANSDARTREIILICAHYDSKTKPDPEDPLANDKSSAAAVLECARILSTVDSNVDLCFLFLSGEEDGYYGSLRIAEGLTEEIKQRIKCVIYVGPVGYVLRDAATLEEEQAENLTEAENAAGTQAADAGSDTDGSVPAADSQEAAAGDSIMDDVNENAGFEIADEDSASLMPEGAPADQAAAQADQGTKVPYLLSVPTDESNDPADLLRALGLYRVAEEMLAGDVLGQNGQYAGAEAYDAAAAAGAADAYTGAETTAYTQADWKRLTEAWEEILAVGQGSLEGASQDGSDTAGGEASAEDTAPQADSAAAEGSPAVAGTPEVTEEVKALAQENLDMLQGLDDWTQVTGNIPYLRNFTDHGMAVTGLFQPIDERLTQASLVRPLQEIGETGTEDSEAQAEYQEQNVGDSLGAEQTDDILLAAGSVSPDAAGEEQENEPRIIPVIDTEELTETADFLASAVSLYMRSQTSIELDQE